MRKWLMVFTTILICSGASAAEGWMTDFEQAKEKAKQENKHILMDFSGSDWCGWCIKLDEEVFSKKAFKDYAQENLVLVLVDFPSDKSGQSEKLQEQNKKLAEQFGVRGFPTVYVLDARGEVVAKSGYRNGGPDLYVEHLKSIISGSKK
ncbi:MAG TPA: thioredoxin family protein [Pontiella sp.]